MAYQEINATGLKSLFEYSNNVTGGIIGIGIALSLYMVVLLYLNGRGEQFADCAVVSGFITVIASIFLYLMGLLAGWHIFIIIMMCILPVIWSYWSKS